MTRFIKIALVFFAFIIQPYANPEWYFSGLKGQNINCLSSDNSYIIAGTDTGLFICKTFPLNWNNWLSIPTGGLPVNDIQKLRPGEFIIAIGDNVSDSDGIYIVELIDSLPYFQIFLVDTMTGPKGLAVQGENGNTIYACNNTYIGKCVRDVNGIFGKLQKLKTIIDNQEELMCSELHFYTEDKKLYAGTRHYLLKLEGDSMIIENELWVTSLSQGMFYPDSMKLYVGTQESGIFVYSPISSTWTNIESPNNESVKDITIGTYDIFSAVDNLVYYKTNGNWNEVAPHFSPLPYAPNCLLNLNTLFAGTVNGVYRVECPMGTIDNHLKNESKLHLLELHKRGNNGISFEYFMPEPGNVSIHILDFNGRTIKKFDDYCSNTGKNTVSWNGYTAQGRSVSSNIYIIKATLGTKQIYKKILLIQ